MPRTMRIRTDDQVVVPAGKDKGKRGRVIRTDPKRRKVYVENLNIVKKHQRPRSVQDTTRGGQTGGIIEQEGPIDVSNVMLIDPKDNKPSRVGVRRGDNGARERFARRSGNSID